MTILVTGVSSSPGYKIALSLVKRGQEVVGIYNQHQVVIEGAQTVRCDLTKGAKDLIAEYRPSVVVHTAALGDVDLCEENNILCYHTNVITTRSLFKEAYKIGAKLIFLSTDYVFDGTKGLYKEEDIPRPINFYGLTKLLGEEITLSLDGIVVRTSAIYGVGPGRLNFGSAIIKKLINREEVHAFTDQWVSPTLNTILGDALARISLDLEFRGIIHVAGPRLSRYEFALAVARAFGFEERLIKRSSINHVRFKAQRPTDSSLSNSKAIKTLDIDLEDLSKSLVIFRKEFQQIFGKVF